MSLKAFHLVFIAAAILLAIGFGVWCIDRYVRDGTVTHLLGGIGSFLAAVGLITYGRYVLRKLKRMSYL